MESDGINVLQHIDRCICTENKATGSEKKRRYAVGRRNRRNIFRMLNCDCVFICIYIIKNGIYIDIKKLALCEEPTFSICYAFLLVLNGILPISPYQSRLLVLSIYMISYIEFRKSVVGFHLYIRMRKLPGMAI